MPEMYYLRTQSQDGRIDANTPLTMKVEIAGERVDNHIPRSANLDLAASLLTLMQMGWSASKAFIILRNKAGENAKIELDRMP